MHYTIPISERQRKLIKSLHRKQKRDENELFVAEGIKLCEELLDSEYEALQVIIKESPPSDVVDLIDKYNEKGVPVYTAPKHKFRQMVKQKTPEGILAVVSLRELDILPDEPFLALDGISDPGNVGTIIRTADWFGVRQVILGKDSANQFGPKVVRASMGSIFKTRVVFKEDLAGFIKENFKDHKIYAADSNAKTNIEKLKPEKKFGIIFGNETHGLTDEVKKLANNKFIIKGNGSAESLNVAISAGITLHYFVRNGK